MAKNDFQYGGWNFYTLQCGTIMTLISPGDCILQCGMWLWNHDSEFTKCDTWLWDDMPLHSPVAASCDVTRSFGIMTLDSPGGSTLHCGRWLAVG